MDHGFSVGGLVLWQVCFCVRGTYFCKKDNQFENDIPLRVTNKTIRKKQIYFTREKPTFFVNCPALFFDQDIRAKKRDETGQE
jgi:hypothetical protein